MTMAILRKLAINVEKSLRGRSFALFNFTTEIRFGQSELKTLNGKTNTMNCDGTVEESTYFMWDLNFLQRTILFSRGESRRVHSIHCELLWCVDIYILTQFFFQYSYVDIPLKWSEFNIPGGFSPAIILHFKTHHKNSIKICAFLFTPRELWSHLANEHPL